MAAFYGSVQGERGEAHRLGHHGMRTVAASWQGAIEVNLSKGEDGETRYVVERRPWHGSGGPPEVLAEGELK